jgi:meiotic recombination protein DMC1
MQASKAPRMTTSVVDDDAATAYAEPVCDGATVTSHHAAAAAAAYAKPTSDGAAAAAAAAVATTGDDLLEIDRLTEAGVAAADIAKLKAAGIFTIPGIHMQCRKDLVAIKGLSEAKVDKIVEAAKKLSACGFVSGVEILQRRSGIMKLTTGCAALDQLLGGGVESCSITEAFGEFRTGKTQIAHTLCVTCQLPHAMGGGNGKAIFIDTESTFRPERIRPIAERFGLDPSAALENILVARAFTHEHQANLIAAVAAKMAEERYSLLVVDSITALFRTDFSGRGELAERQQKLGKMMNHLMKVAEEFGVAVYITNQVVADPGGGSVFVADPKKPVGGHVLAHASTTRLSLRKGRGEQRICKIYDSPSLPETECVFAISEQGIVDAKE